MQQFITRCTVLLAQLYETRRRPALLELPPLAERNRQQQAPSTTTEEEGERQRQRRRRRRGDRHDPAREVDPAVDARDDVRLIKRLAGDRLDHKRYVPISRSTVTMSLPPLDVDDADGKRDSPPARPATCKTLTPDVILDRLAEMKP